MSTRAASLGVALLLLIGSGCALSPSRWGWHRPRPCTFTENATKQEIVAHVSRFAAAEGDRPPLTAWRATQAKINFPGMPAVPATIDIEAPSRIRIRASMIVSNSEIADIGCNAHEIWIWHRQAPNEIVTIKHEHLPQALERMQLPFDPDWMMEVLGVAPMNFDDFELRRPTDPKAKWVDLVAQRRAPTGEAIHRVVRVDLCYGRIIEHRIEGLDGTLIAAARLDNYGPDASGQFIMPHLVQVDWPAQNASLKLELGRIHANPPPLADSEWNVPRMAGVELKQLVPPGLPASDEPTADPRYSWHEPLYREASGESTTRMDVIPDAASAAAPRGAYSPGASRSSSGRRLREPESEPPPFPAQP